MEDLIPMFGLALLVGLCGYFIGVVAGYKRAETYYLGLLAKTHAIYFRRELERLKRPTHPQEGNENGSR